MLGILNPDKYFHSVNSHYGGVFSASGDVLGNCYGICSILLSNRVVLNSAQEQNSEQLSIGATFTVITIKIVRAEYHDTPQSAYHGGKKHWRIMN